PAGLLEPAQLAGRDVELVEPVRDVRVVLQVPRHGGAAGAEAAPQPAVAVRERAEQELAEPARRLEPVRPLEPPGRLREPREREPVPGRDRLVVEPRLRALLAHREEPLPILGREVAAEDEAAVLERLQKVGARRSERRLELLGRPRERQAL